MSKLTPFHRENLMILLVYLKTLPEDYQHFDMKTYCVTGHNLRYVEPIEAASMNVEDCGTMLCLAGHAVLAGVPLLAEDGGDWDHYIYRALASGWFFEYLFSSYWIHHDNTLKGGIERLEKVIDGFGPTRDDLPWRRSL